MDTQLPTRDHDLLIRLDQRVENLTTEIRSMRDDAVQRLAKVEALMVERKEFEEYKRTFALEMTTAFQTRKDSSDEYRKNTDASLKIAFDVARENKKDITSLQRLIYIGLGAIATLQFLAPYLLKYFFHI